jgi:S1-C subfamily serine protease
MSFLRHIALTASIILSQLLAPATPSVPAQAPAAVQRTPAAHVQAATPATHATGTAVVRKESPIKKDPEMPEVTFGTTGKTAKTSATKVSKKKTVATAPKKSPLLPAIAEPQQPVAQAVPKPPADFEKINQSVRQAIVNIICTRGDQEISGTGVVVDPRGIIVTNAHLGQYLLVKDYPTANTTSCVVRTGSPARTRYVPELMYISPSWVQNNPTVMKETDPRGTGQYDFAFLRIAARTDGSPLPDAFPYVQTDMSEPITKNSSVVLVSYPAGFLGGTSILMDLNVSSAVTTIRDYFTFTADSTDLISVPGTIISQRGSSGGAAVDGDGMLIGIITTSSEATTTSARELNAITISHISRTLQNETGKPLADFLVQNPAETARAFQADTAPALAKLIEDGLK